MNIKPLRFVKSEDRQRWEDFFQRLAVCIRMPTVVSVIDDCKANPRISAMCLRGAAKLFREQENILAVHRLRGVPPC